MHILSKECSCPLYHYYIKSKDLTDKQTYIHSGKIHLNDVPGCLVKLLGTLFTQMHISVFFPTDMGCVSHSPYKEGPLQSPYTEGTL